MTKSSKTLPGLNERTDEAEASTVKAAFLKDAFDLVGMGTQLSHLLEDVRDTAYRVDDIHLIRATLFLLPHARQISDDTRIMRALGIVLRHFQDIEEEKEARACVAAAAAGRAAAAARAFADAAAAGAGQETSGRVTAAARAGLAWKTRRCGLEMRRGVTAAAAGEDGLETRGRVTTATAAAAGDKEDEAAANAEVGDKEDEAANAEVWFDAEEDVSGRNVPLVL